MISLEAQLNASVRMQIENTREGIQRLGASQDRLRSISQSLEAVTRLCQESEGLIENYPTIKQVSRTCQNFRLIRSVYDQLMHLDETVARTSGLLEQDIESGCSDNLLLVYYHLQKLEGFRGRTLDLMKDAPSTTMYTLKRYFKKLDDLSAEFDAFFWSLPKDFFALALRGQQPVLTRWAKVFSKMERTARSRLTTLLDDWVNSKFNLVAQSFAKVPSEDVEGTLQAISFWLGDMTTVRDGLVPCFPPDLALMDFYTLTYHQHIRDVFSKCLTLPEGNVLQAGDILFALRWTRDYHDKMASEVGMSASDLEPVLLDDHQESFLIQQYSELARGKIAEWIGNLYETERISFTQRPSDPEIDANGFYISPAAVDLLQIIKQHVTTTCESGQGKLILQIISDTVKIVADFQRRIGALVEQETEKYLAKPEQVPPRFESYLLMMGNTGLRWATSLQSEIVDSLDQIVPTECLASASKQFKSLSEGFVDIAKQVSLVLCKIIFSAVQPAIQQLFTPIWYSPDHTLVDTITVTFGDFFSDYKAHAEDFLFAKLVADVLERFLVSYLLQLRAKTTKLKTAECPQILEDDLRTTLDFFSTFRDPRRVQKVMDALQKFTNLITSSQKMVYLEFFTFWKVFPDLPIQVFEEVLAKRDDLDKAALKDILETCRKKTLEDQRPTDIQPSIFSKLPSLDK